MTTPSLLSEIQRYAAAGLRVLPVRERSEGEARAKQPYTTHGFHDATTDPETIRQWWHRWPGAAVGFATGTEGGLIVIDLDVKGDVNGINSWQGLVERHGGAPRTREVKTPSGGLHLYFTVPSGQGGKLKSSAGKLGPGVDVRAAGGYIIAPPSTTEAGSYEWADRTIPIAQAPAWLVSLIQAPPKERKPAPAIVAAESTPYGLTALEDECRAVAKAPEGGRNHRLNEAAFACGQLVAGGQLTETEALTALEESADACGLGQAETRKTIESGFRAGLLEPRTPPAQAEPVGESDWCREGGQAAPVLPWPDFIDFDEQPPDLPVGILPGILGEFAEGLAEAAQAPRELAAVNVLGVVALAVQHKMIVRVKPDYSEGLNIYAICASEPGERKSSVVSACKAPLIEWEIEQERLALENIREVLSERRTLEKAIDKARTKAASAKTSDDRKEAARAIYEMERELPEIPSTPRLLVDDVTPEALASIMAASGESIGMLEAEGGALDTFSGRYSNSTPNIDLLLKSFGAEPVIVDRKGKEPIRLRKPRLTMVLTPQPSVLQTAGSNQVFMGRGLIARCLLVLPRPRVGFRNNSETMSLDLTRKWAAYVTGLLSIPGQAEPYELVLSPEAFSLWLDFSNDVEVGQRPGGEFEFMRPWASKLTGLVVRLAGLLHMAQGLPAIHMPIEFGSMRNAVMLATWAAEHAKHVFSSFGLDDGQEAAKRALEWIRKERRELVTAREIFKALRGRFPTMEKVRPGLDALVDRGALISRDKTRSSQKGGRPSESFGVNPAVYEVSHA